METNHKNLLDGSVAQYNNAVVPKVSIFSGKDMTSEVYYFKPEQVLKIHKHPNGEQIFFFLKGNGTMIIEEKEHPVSAGDTIFIEANQWHSIVNGDNEEMVAVQVTKVNAGADFK